MKKKLWIKLLSGILTVSLSLGNSVTAFAEEITVNADTDISIETIESIESIESLETDEESEEIEILEEDTQNPQKEAEDISQDLSSEEEIKIIPEPGQEPVVEYHLNPWYEGEYTEEDLKTYFEENLTEEELYPDEDSFTSYDAEASVVSDLKKALQERKSVFTYSSSSFDIQEVMNKAMEDTDETDPFSGDYIKGNYYGYRSSAQGYGGGYYITVNISWLCYNDAEAEEKQVVSKANQIVKELGLKNSGLSDYDKVKLIHDYLCDTIDYTNDGSLGCHGTYAALVKGKCVCQGYANAFTKLTRMAGIASKYIVGSEINHAWNICKVKGGTDPQRPWYNMDVTWDDPGRYDYFLKNNLDFDDHPRNDEYETDAYNKKHPISLYNWGETKVGLDKDNPEYFFECTDGTSLSTQVENKRPKILIYCTPADLRNKNKSYTALKSLAASDFVKKRKADIYAIDYGEKYGSTREQLLEYEKVIGSDRIKFAYYTEEVDDYINEITGSRWFGLTFVMIDENNKIQFIRQNRDLTGKIIKNLYMYYLKDGWDPTADAKSVSVRKYTSAENLEKDIYTTLSGKTLSVKFGEEIYLKGVANPNKSGIKDFVSTTTAVVSDPEGAIKYDAKSYLLQAVSKGTASITFSSDYNDEVKTTIKVSVVPAPIKSITLDKTSVSLVRGESEKLTVSYNPEKTTDSKQVTWTSSMPDVVSVVSDGESAGIITAKASGSAVITAKCGKCTATCRVSTISPVTGVSIRSDASSLYVGERISLSAAITPIDATIVKGISWSSSDPSLAAIYLNERKDVCELTGIKAGKLKLTLSVDGKSASKDLTVLPVSLSLDPAGGKIPAGAAGTITGKIGDPLGDLPIPGFDGKIFTGWYTGKNSTGQRVSESTIFDKDLLDTTKVLYAGWKSAAENEITILPVADMYYTGAAVKPEVEVYFGEKKLNPGKDYSVSYKDNIKASDNARIIVKGKGNYTETAITSFRILPKNISDSDIVVDYSKLTGVYNGKAQLLKPVVKMGKKSLKAGTDYVAEYDDTTPGAYTNPGQYRITLKGKGPNYCGATVIYESIIRKDLVNISKCKVTYTKTCNYTGEAIKPVVTVKEGKTVLNVNEAYTIDYYDNVEAGNAYFVISGIGAYTGNKKFLFTIKGTPLKNTVVTFDRSSFEYTGSRCKPVPTVVEKGTSKVLQKDVDYEVSYLNNVKPGTASVILTGKGRYSGTVKKTFAIKPADLSRAVVKDKNGNEKITVSYEKGGAVPVVNVYLDGRELIQDIDYVVKCSGNNKLGNAAVMKITGKGYYGKTKTVAYSVTESRLQDNPKAYIIAGDCSYNKAPGKWIPVISVVDSNGKKLVAGTDYDKNISYQYVYDSTMTDGTTRSAGEVPLKTDSPVTGTVIRASVSGINCYAGTELTATYRIIDKAMSIASGITFKIPDQYYTGREITVDKKVISFILKGKDGFNSECFEIVENSYISNIKKGTAKVTLRGKGAFGGTKVVSFKIAPRKIN